MQLWDKTQKRSMNKLYVFCEVCGIDITMAHQEPYKEGTDEEGFICNICYDEY